MKNLTQNCLIFLYVLLTPFISYAQGCIHEIPFHQQIDVAAQIVEGKVLDQASSWDDAGTKIYTIHTIEVYKIFKGELMTTLEVITEGGAVGLNAQIVTPSLELKTGEIGVFLLHENNISLKSVDSVHPKYRVYGSLQGFYRYDFIENKAVNPHHAIMGIASNFYDELAALTGRSIQEVQSFSVDKQTLKSNNTRNIIIESMSPMTITAGTRSVLTINGSGFGDQQGAIAWSDSDSGGDNFIFGADSDVLSWSDTQIEVYVVGRAGSGEIGVEHADGSREFSDDLEITVPFSHSNILVNGLIRLMQHVDANGSGGYIWHFSEEFNANAAAKESFIAALETWRCETGINWEISSVTSTDVYGFDGINTVGFGSSSELMGRPARSTLSVFSCSSAQDRYVPELDLTFNRERDWYFGTDEPPSGEIGFGNTAIHELGHSFILGHVNDENDIMYFAAAGATELGENNLMGAAYVRNKSDNIPICDLPPTESHPDPCGMVTSTEDALTGSIEVFPNPVKDILIINSKGTELGQIIIYDAKGHVVLVTNVNNHTTSYEIKVNELPAGIYFLELTTATGTIVEKIIR